VNIAIGELAARFGCELRGDPALTVARVATLADAGEGDLAFLANPRYRPLLAATRATVVVLDAASAAHYPGAVLLSANPYATYARIAALLHPEPCAPPGVQPTAVLAPGVALGEGVHVGPGAVIGAGAVVGARSSIGAGSVLGEGVIVGSDCQLHARVVLERGTRLGDRVRILPGAVLGAAGFGFARERQGWVAVPQLGGVSVGDDVDIGANTTIDRGAIGDTVIEQGVKLDNQIQVAHNVRIGAHTAIAACVGISGSTRIGARCMIGGAVGIVGHLEICDDVIITGMSMVAHSIATPGVYSGGLPAAPAPLWRRLAARFRRIERLAARVARLEQQGAAAGAAPATDEPQEQHDD
jgi:UDP-3-O-[3-hydroxymyristoyl] glucosamine N-acyltransferase